LILEDLLHILAQHRVQLAGLVVMVFGNATDDNVSVGDDATWLMIVVHDRNHTHTLLLHELRSLENAVILLEEVGVLGADVGELEGHAWLLVHLKSGQPFKPHNQQCS